jgi:hypothetical protein
MMVFIFYCLIGMLLMAIRFHTASDEEIKIKLGRTPLWPSALRYRSWPAWWVYGIVRSMRPSRHPQQERA